MKKLKIAFSGAHSTGKTTLINDIKDRLKSNNYGYVSDIASHCPLPILREHTINSTLWIACRNISDEIELYHKYSLTLVDRPVLDAWAYYAASLSVNSRKKEYNDLYNHGKDSLLYNIVSKWLPTYDYIYQTEIDPSIKINPEKNRDTDEEYRKIVGEECKKALDFFGIKCCQFITTNNRDIIISKVLEDIRCNC